MKILIDTGKFTPTENSILVFKDNKWELTTRQEYLSYQDKILLLQSKKIDELEEEISLIKEGDEIAFRGKLYEEGFGWTDCELVR